MAALVLLAYLAPARAATRTVTTLADSGAGSLRQAVADAASGDTIRCAATLAGGTISLTSGALVIGQSLTIDGRAAAGLTLSGHNDSRVLQISAGSVSLTGLIIADGQTHWSPRATQPFQNGGGAILNNGQLSIDGCTLVRNVSFRGGGAIENFGTLIVTSSILTGNYAGLDGGAITNNGTANISNSSLSGNYAANGAALINGGTLSLKNSTLSGNIAANEGGALENFGKLVLCSCTIAGNSARSAGGGLANFHAATVNNSIIAANLCADNAADADVSGAVTSAGYNLIGIRDGSGAAFSPAKHDLAGSASASLDAKLGVLQNNGGNVPTMALMPGSPALEAGDDSVTGAPNSLTTDARGTGFARLRGVHVDMGAFEGVPATPSLSVGNARTVEEGSAATPGSTTFTVTLSAPFDRIVSVNYQSADGTAQAGSDYVAKNGTLSFAPGETVKRVTVTFVGDEVAELNETFFLDLRAPTNATLADSRGSAYIRNDDGPKIFIDNALAVDEGNGGTKLQKFTVRLSEASATTISVDWNTANNTAGPADYVVAGGTLSFAPGTTSKILVVSIKGDTLVEPTETYRVNLSNPRFAVLGDSQGIGYIRDDDGAPAPGGIQTEELDEEPSQ